MKPTDTRITLSQITYAHLDQWPAWEATGEVEDTDIVLVPAPLTDDGLVPPHIGEVWCRSVCRFADGSERPACSMSRGDNDDGPLSYTVFNGEHDVSLIAPPAPDFVLAIDGPGPFAAAFGLDVQDVFPVEIEVMVGFVTPPRRRSVRIGIEGILSR